MRHRQRATNAATVAAIIALVYLSILWPLEAGAQDDPLPTPEISATWWWPTPTPQPQRHVWLPVVARGGE